MVVNEETSNTQTNDTIFLTEPSLKIDKWAENEFGNALLGDPRLDF